MVTSETLVSTTEACEQNNFAAAFRAIANDPNIRLRERAACELLADALDKHPRLAKLVKHLLLARYEAWTQEIVGAPDWPTIIKWAIENLPAIMNLLLSLLALFA